MTKILAHFQLERPADEGMLSAIRNAQAVYGIERVSLAKSLDRLTVEYDASRLRPEEIESRLRFSGLPVFPVR